jgi:hypothetical protein
VSRNIVDKDKHALSKDRFKTLPVSCQSEDSVFGTLGCLANGNLFPSVLFEKNVLGNLKAVAAGA